MSLISDKDKIYVAGHTGLAGSALIRHLEKKGYNKIITRTHKELDLLNSNMIEDFFQNEKPDIVIIAAAKVGGIFANNEYRADFIYENLQIQNNVIWQAFKNNVRRLVFLGSSCIYPKFSEQPIRESSLLTGSLEYTNQPYAIAKIAGLELINSLRKQYKKDYFSVMPTNLFGINDNFHPDKSHVLASLIRKFCDCKNNEIVVCGDGSPLREFLYSDELASAIIFLMENLSFDDLNESHIGQQNLSHINIGSGFEISIKDLAYLIAKIIDYKGSIIFDHSMPNGTPRKIMDSSYLQKLGWKSIISFEESLKMTIDWYKSKINN